LSKDSKKFYASIATDYDQMTNFETRLENEIEVLKKWQERYKFKSILDVACGSGLHSIAFKKIGLEVIGVDLSAEMIQLAEHNAKRQNVNIEWICSGMQDLSNKVSSSFDAVFCLGNSLPHLLTREDLQNTLRGFNRILNQGGIVVLQLLNFSRILKHRERIVNITRKNELGFIRFYDFIDPLIQFNILRIDWRNDKAKHQLYSTELFPYLQKDLIGESYSAGFKKVENFGTMNFDSFDEDTSANLILVGTKSN